MFYLSDDLNTGFPTLRPLQCKGHSLPLREGDLTNRYQRRTFCIRELFCRRHAYSSRAWLYRTSGR